MNKWKSLLIFMPIIVIVSVTNFIVNYKYNINVKPIAQSMINGNCVGFPKDCVIPERGVKENIIELMPKTNKSVAIGPSLIMGIRKNSVDSNSFYNLGMSSSTLNEQLAQFGLLEYTNSQYENLIWCFDYYIFDDRFSNGIRDNSSEVFKEHMIELIGDSNYKPITQCEINKTKLLKIHNFIVDIFSLKSFKYSIKSLLNLSINDLIAGFEIFDDRISTFVNNYYKPDGSWVYSVDYRSKSHDEIEKKMKEYDLDSFVSKNKHINKENKDTVEKVIKYLTNKRTKIKIFLCPHPPIIWDRIVNESGYYLPYEIDEFANEMSKKYECQIIGSHNPYNIDIKNEDFYDATHVRHEKLAEYFSFKFD